jgi:TRAP-type C4-dicarboxylate transport system permease small subunit
MSEGKYMARRTKLLIAISLVLLVIGGVLNSDLVHWVDAAWIYVVFPLGAVFLGLALISRLLEKETPVFDRDHQAALEGGAGPPDRAVAEPPRPVSSHG